MFEQENSCRNEKRAALQGATKPRFGEVKIRDRGRLPHWEREAGLYFVTFRLDDSLPKAVLKKIAERQRVLKAAKHSGLKLLPRHKVLIAEFSPKKIEEYLDSGNGACHLRDPQIAESVVNTLHFRNGKRYRLIAWCVMPNHVHVIFRLLPGYELEDTLRNWKSFTAKTANRILNRKGTFWRREYYDRLIRDGKELDRAIRYVMTNPERAGLKDWRWVGCADETSPRQPVPLSGTGAT